MEFPVRNPKILWFPHAFPTLFAPQKAASFPDSGFSFCAEYAIMISGLWKKCLFCRFAAACFCSLLPLHPARGRRICTILNGTVNQYGLLHPARGRRICARITGVSECPTICYTPQGDVGYELTLSNLRAVIERLHPARGRRIIHFNTVTAIGYTPQGDTDDRPALLHSFVRRSGAAAFL